MLGFGWNAGVTSPPDFNAAGGAEIVRMSAMGRFETLPGTVAT
jgi:hypothetical protein